MCNTYIYQAISCKHDMYAVGKFYNTNSLTHKIIIMMHVARLMG